LRVEEYNGERPSIQLIVREGECSDTTYLEEPDNFVDERKLNIDFQADPSTACGQLETMLIVTDIKEESDIRWIADFGFYNGDSLTMTFAKPGVYDIVVYAESKTSGCIEELEKHDFIEVTPPPVADFTVDNQYVSVENSLISFYNNSLFADSYSWNFGDGDFSVETSPMHDYGSIGTYLAELIAASDDGCSDTTMLEISVVMNHVFAPNAFRPNSPIAENTIFMPDGLGLDGSNFLLRIYDRWGQVVFESTSVANPWDGKDKKGKEAPMGNYIWTATFVDALGQEHRQNGQILLIR